MISNIFSAIIGFISGIAFAFGKGWVDELFKKREENRKQIEIFMGKVIDLIAIATSNGYKLRQNEKDRRRIQRASFQLERLGKTEVAQNIRDYLYKWDQIYELHQGKIFTKEDFQQNSGLIGEVDKLATKIIKG